MQKKFCNFWDVKRIFREISSITLLGISLKFFQIITKIFSKYPASFRKSFSILYSEKFSIKYIPNFRDQISQNIPKNTITHFPHIPKNFR